MNENEYWKVDVPQKHFQMYRVKRSEAVTLEQALEIVRKGDGEISGNPIFVETLDPLEYPWLHVDMDDVGLARGGYSYTLSDKGEWIGERVY